METPNNPYLPPSSELVAPEPERELVQASRGRRFGTYVIDYMGYMVFSIVIGVILGLTLGERAVMALEGLPELLLGVGILFAYYGLFEGIWARTPGKWLFGTVVVDEQGGKPSFGQIMGRTACRFIPFEPFSFFGESGTGWHDRIPKTRVVMAR